LVSADITANSMPNGVCEDTIFNNFLPENQAFQVVFGTGFAYS
jgi:hypothetical protein